ncbi:MAG TPA: hypothetical protein VF509_07895 [Sphingobium sp.]
MNPWPFVITAYALTLLGTALLCVVSWRAMRSAERRADAMKRGQD